MKRKPDAALAPRWRPAPLLPREPAQDALLVFVTAVLCCFACLAAIAALGANRAAAGWTSQLKGSATVLVRPTGGESADAAAERAAETLSGVKGVKEAVAMERQKAEALVRPWLGQAADLADLPLPRLVTVELDPARRLGAGDLDRALKAAGVDAVVDDHSRWIKDIVNAGRLARLAAVSAAALMGLAAAAVVAFATRAGLLARRDIVEVLHLSGAEDGFIAGLFQNRLAELAAVAGAIGAAVAALIAAAVRLLGGGEGLTPALPIAWTDVLAVLPCPLIAGVVAAVAARLAARSLTRSLM